MATEATKRRNSRPQNEFGGNIGTFFWTFSIPVFIYYFYGVNVMHRGALAVPDKKFWNDLIWALPEGINIQPTRYGWMLVVTWVILQLFLECFLPISSIFGGQGMHKGVVLKSGRRLNYSMNGLLAYGLTHVIYFAVAYYTDWITPYVAWEHMGSFLTCANITSFVFALWLYIDFGLMWRRHVNQPSFEEDWGVFSIWNFWNDFFMGVARNPRIGHSWPLNKLLPYGPVDLKRWWDGRTLTLWILFNWSYLAAQYFGCTLQKTGDNTWEASCLAEGDWSRIGLTAWLISWTHFYYIFDYNYFEPAYLTTTDIRHDLFGYMLTYGMFGFLSTYYPISFNGYLSAQGVGNEIVDNYTYQIIGVAMVLLGLFLFRFTNIEKHRFRTKIWELKQVYKKSSSKSLAKHIDDGLVGFQIFPWDSKDKLKYLRTEEGSYLLCSGTWGWARHFNYCGDLIMCFGWAIACYSPKNAFVWIPLSYCAYFWVMDLHRASRDHQRCHDKYKKDWDKYCEIVSYVIVPGVF